MTKLNNNKGVALIAAVVTTVIFLMLVIAVTVISIATYKKSVQGHDRAVALYLAEAGINHVLFRMNYQDYSIGGSYPTATNQYFIFPVPPSVSFGIWGADPGFWAPPDFNVGSYNGNPNGYKVKFLAKGPGGDPNYDKFVSTGNYNGKVRTVSVLIRGNNTSPSVLSYLTNGIAEAFNKHAVYANTVTVAGTPTITGNIARVTLTAITAASSNYTVTTVPPPLFGVPDFLPAPVGWPPPIWTYIYTDGSRTGSTFVLDGLGSYAGGTYIFNATGLSTLPVSTNLYFVTGPVDGVPTVGISALAAINNSIGTDGSLILDNSKIIGSGVVFQPAGGITVSPGITINGDLIVAGTPIPDLNGVTILGSVLCDNSITLSGSASTISVPSASTKEAAILINSTTATTIIISAGASPVITLGPNQKAFIINYTTGATAGITINTDLTTTLNPSSKNQSTAVAYVSGAGTASISTGNGVSVNGLLYASSLPGGTGIIIIGSTAANTGIITGSVVAKDTVTLNNGTLTYDATNFKNPIISSDNDIYKGFSGGRRVYLPVPGSWQEQ